MSPRTKTRFEEGYLERTYGSIIRRPDIALTELIANAADAGASEVRVTIPEVDGDELIVDDDGCGMTGLEFKRRWMTLAYNRLRHQGEEAEFPPERQGHRRRAFGRNGIGRHGLFCFGDEYEIATRKGGRCFTGSVRKSAEDGAEPFSLVDEQDLEANGHGTRLTVRVQRNRPSPTSIAEAVGCRFVADPGFRIFVNGTEVRAADSDGMVDRQVKKLACGVVLELMAFDAGSTGRTTRQSGVAFWVGGRLVGEAGWTVGKLPILDGRLKQAKRLVIVAKSEDLFDEVEADWSAFRDGQKVDEVYAAVVAYAGEVIRKHLREHIVETQETVLRDNIDRVRDLDRIERDEVTSFVEGITNADPTMPPGFVATAMDVFMGLMESRSGRSLIQRLSSYSPDDVANLDRILEDWTVQDCKAVLDEIGMRMRVVEAIDKLMSDRNADELHVLHPLVTQARWLFGPEFESSAFTSNVTVRSAMEKVFAQDFPAGKFVNPKKRPDLLVLPERTLSATASEDFDTSGTLAKISRILLIELKRGSFEIGRQEVNQAAGYIQDIHGTGLLQDAPFINAFVVGHTISPKTADMQEISLGDRRIGLVRACTYGKLVQTANARLFRLRPKVQERYDGLVGPTLMDRIIATTGLQGSLVSKDGSWAGQA